MARLWFKNNVQQIYLSGDDDKLYRILIPILRNKSKRIAGCYRNFQVDASDLESEFVEALWELSQRRYDKDCPYLFYDMLMLICESRKYDVIRKLRLKRKYARDGDNHVILYVRDEAWMDDHASSVTHVFRSALPTIEDVEWRVTVEQDKRLTDTERTVLRYILEYPSTTLTEVADATGVSRQTVHRLRKHSKNIFSTFSKSGTRDT